LLVPKFSIPSSFNGMRESEGSRSREVPHIGEAPGGTPPAPSACLSRANDGAHKW